jgi:hypothetical protein
VRDSTNENKKQNSKEKQKKFQWKAFLLEKGLGIPPELLRKEGWKDLLSSDILIRAIKPKALKKIQGTFAEWKRDFSSEVTVNRRIQENIQRKRISKKKNLDKYQDTFSSFSNEKASLFQGNDSDRLKAFKSTFSNTSYPSVRDIQIDFKPLLQSQQSLSDLVGKSFKEVNTNLKDILKAINNLDLSSSGSPGFFPDNFSPGKKGKGTPKKTTLKSKVAKAASVLLPFAGKVATAGAFIAPPAIAAVDVYRTRAALQKAEDLGVLSKEQAALLRQKTAIAKGTAGAAGLAGGIAGASMLGPAGALAGAFGGQYLGEKVGKSLGDYYTQDKIDRESAYLATVANIESGLSAQPKATGTSNAAGLYQFIPSTWQSLNKKYNKNWDISPGNDPRLDPKKALTMMKLLTRENQTILEKKLGRKVTDVELYAAHFLGPEDASRLLQVSPEASATTLLPKAAGANPQIFYTPEGRGRTTGELKNLLSSKYQKRALELGITSDVILPSTLPITPITQATLPTEQVLNATPPPIVTENVIQSVAKAEGQKLTQDTITQNKIQSSLEKLATNSNATFELQKTQQAQTSKGARQGALFLGGANNQSIMSDINSIHFTDGMLLNILL